MRIAVLCKYHLDELEQYRTNVDGDGDVEILVEPCEKCMADERDDAYALGVKEEREEFLHE